MVSEIKRKIRKYKRKKNNFEKKDLKNWKQRENDIFYKNFMKWLVKWKKTWKNKSVKAKVTTLWNIRKKYFPKI